VAFKCKEKRAAYDKQYNQDNKEARSAYRKQYYQDNKEEELAYHKQYHLDNQEKILLRTKEHYQNNKAEIEDKRLKRRYGINSQEYDSILADQNGCCPICLKHHTEFDKKLSVDHIHDRVGGVDYNKGVSAAVRGLLCGPCNKALGGLGDSMDNLIRAIGYKMANDLCPFTLTKRETHEED
jgi:hypothetical protein